MGEDLTLLLEKLRVETVTGAVLNLLPPALGYGAVMQLIPSLTTQASFTPGARDVQVTPGMQVFGGQGGRENEGNAFNQRGHEFFHHRPC